MITCPWCGTSYREFQSNCSRCGGPLPAEKSGVGFAPAEQYLPDELRLPPPPPRVISTGYAFRLFFSDGWGITGFVFLLLGIVYSIIGSFLIIPKATQPVGIPFFIGGLVFLAGGLGITIWRFQQHLLTVKVLRNGVPAKGEISAVSVNYSVRVNGQNPWTIHYRYQIVGSEYEGKIVTTNPPYGYLQKGNPAIILYLPDNPGVSSLYPHP